MIDAEKVLVAVGRKACCDKETVEALNLEMRGSTIKVGEKMETSAKGVYAIGDVAGKTYLAHGATTEADVAAANAMGGDVKMSDYSLIPRVIYTFPEVASVGKNEQARKSQGLNISVGKAFFRANGRSAASNETVGEIRAVKDNSTNKIIGITMAGTMVTELVAAAAAFIGRKEEESRITFAHPTISETLKEAVENAFAS
jgi:dihydrolipoamide dehydrogenase